MSSSYGADATATPLLERKKAKEGWLSKVTKDQILFALPMIVTNVSYYFIPLVSVMFVGYLGHLNIAGSNLANSWAAVTGYALMEICHEMQLTQNKLLIKNTRKN